MMVILLSLFLGTTLAAAAGLRAFLPLFLLGVLERAQLLAPFSIGENFQWLTTDIAILTLGIATVVEVTADKLPAVDTALDSGMTFIRPAAGAVSVFAVMSSQDPLLGYIAGFVLAGVSFLARDESFPKKLVDPGFASLRAKIIRHHRAERIGKIAATRAGLFQICIKRDLDIAVAAHTRFTVIVELLQYLLKDRHEPVLLVINLHNCLLSFHQTTVSMPIYQAEMHRQIILSRSVLKACAVEDFFPSATPYLSYNSSLMSAFAELDWPTT